MIKLLTIPETTPGLYLTAAAFFKFSPACKYCNASIKDSSHYFLYCSSFTTLRNILFSSAAHLLGDRWLSASDKKRIDWLLNGVPDIEFQINIV